MNTLITNLRTYLKFLSRNKVYTFVSIVGFSISLMFVILLALYAKQELSVDQFHEKKDRIYLSASEQGPFMSNSMANYISDRCPEVESFCRAYPRTVVTKVEQAERFIGKAMFVDSTFFKMFSFDLIEGNKSNVLAPVKSVVLTQTFARKYFDNENPIGKNIEIEETQYTITGIMADMPHNTIFPDIDFLVDYISVKQFWGYDILNEHNNFSFSIYFLEKENSNLKSKEQALLNDFKEDIWIYKRNHWSDFEFLPLTDVYFDQRGHNSDFKHNSKTLIYIYIMIVILIFAIAALNYVNMTVAQAGFRGKEAAIRKLLGSSKLNIVGQLLLESLLITIFTFAIGFVLALAVEPHFDELFNTKLQILQHLTPKVIAIIIGLIAIIALLAGLIPAVIISSFNPIEVIKGTFKRKVKSTYSKVLITFQYVVAITLLISTFSIKQQTNYLMDYELGYSKDCVFTMNVQLDTVQTKGFESKLLSIPEIEMVSYSQGTPMDRGNNNTFNDGSDTYSTQEIRGDAKFLDLYGLKYTPTGVPFVGEAILINKNLYYSTLTDSINKTIKWYDNKIQIAGILEDFRLGTLHIEENQYIVVRNLSSSWRPWSISVKINSNSDIYTIADRIQKGYTAYTGGKIGQNPQFVDDITQDWYKKENSLSHILSLFSFLTIVISIMGVFAMSMYMIKQTEKEIGIRKVNGATITQVLVMLNKNTLKLTVIAFFIACPLSYYFISQWLEQFPYRIAIDWIVFFISGAAIAALTLLSVSYLTWQAAKANVIEIIKSE